MNYKMSRFQEIFLHVGDFGKFQKQIYVLLNFLTIFQCCQNFLLVFIADKPEWQCSENEDIFLDVKTKQQGYPCYKNGSTCQNITFKATYSSITTEWELVCSQEYKINTGQAVILAGRFAGAIMFGGMADKYGRKFAIIVLQALAAVFCFTSGLAQSYNQFVVLRFLTTATLTGSRTTMFVLMSEILGPRSRDILLTAFQGFYACGFVVLGVLAYFIRDWRNLTLVISLPFVIFSLIPWSLVCESPQWLLEKGKFEEATHVLKDMAEGNGCKIPEEYLEKLSRMKPKGNSKESQNLSTGTIFTAEGNSKKIGILAMIWFLLSMLYTGLSFASKSTGGSKYVSFSLSGLVEIPSLILSMFLVKSGRRRPLFNLAVAGALACLICAWFTAYGSQVGSLLIFLAMLGKSCVSACYSILYILSAEMFPAKFRGFSMSIFSTVSRMGGIFAPLLVNLELYDKRLPMFVFSIATICSALLVLPLPETLPVMPREELKEHKVE